MPTQPPVSTSTPSSSTSPPPSTPKRKRRSSSSYVGAPQNTLYDAIAGRLTTRSSLLNPSQHTPSSISRDRIDRSLAPLRPAEALWRSSASATSVPRFAERDVYDAARDNLPAGARGEGVLRSAGGTWPVPGKRDGEGKGGSEGVMGEYEVRWDGIDVRKGKDVEDLETEEFGGVEEVELGPEAKRERRERLELMRLPESDLCKGVHAYVSDFYGALVMERRDEVKRREKERNGGLRKKSARAQDAMWNFRSMDETALLAIGILLEESVAAVLGETGDMVFVEGETEERDIDGNERDRSKTADFVGPTDTMIEDFEIEDARKEPDKNKKKGKRVRIQDDEDGYMEGSGERRRRKKRRRLQYEGNEDY